jgi:hypothetical protein
MDNIKVFRTKERLGILEPLSAKREWMDNTFESHAYKCFPVSLSNQLGWGISFPEDISFIWDGISDSSPDHVKILSGQKYAYSGRANGTISFNSGLVFKTDTNLSLLSMPVPNLFIDGAVPFTTIMSSSFFTGPLPIAWMITKPNEVITIKAGTPVVAVLPIDLSSLNNSEMVFQDTSKFPQNPYNNIFDPNEYMETIKRLNNSGDWSNFYRDAVDHLKRKIGSHQVKSIRLKVSNDIINYGGKDEISR